MVPAIRLRRVLTTVVSLSMMVYSAPADLVAYYTFEGSDASDLSGNSNDGVLGSSVSFSSDTPSSLGGGRRLRTDLATV